MCQDGCPRPAVYGEGFRNNGNTLAMLDGIQLNMLVACFPRAFSSFPNLRGEDNGPISKTFRALGTGIGIRGSPLILDTYVGPKDTECFVNMQPVKRSGSTIKKNECVDEPSLLTARVPYNQSPKKRTEQS